MKFKFKKGDIVCITEKRLNYEIRILEDVLGKHASNTYIILNECVSRNSSYNVFKISNLDNMKTFEYHIDFLELHKSHIRKEKIDKILKDDN